MASETESSQTLRTKSARRGLLRDNRPSTSSNHAHGYPNGTDHRATCSVPAYERVTLRLNHDSRQRQQFSSFSSLLQLWFCLVVLKAGVHSTDDVDKSMNQVMFPDEAPKGSSHVKNIRSSVVREIGLAEELREALGNCAYELLLLCKLSAWMPLSYC